MTAGSPTYTQGSVELAMQKGWLAAAAPSEVARLTRSMQRGDEEAYREFFGRYFHRLLAYLLVVTRGNEMLARDLVQQTMIKVAKHIRFFEDDAAFWRWLSLLARTSAVDESRKSRRYFNFLERWWRRDDREEQAPKISLETLLSSELETLDQEERFILEQKYFAANSVKEIAQHLGMTEKAVESRLSRLRAKLKERLLIKLKHEES